MSPPTAGPSTEQLDAGRTLGEKKERLEEAESESDSGSDDFMPRLPPALGSTTTTTKPAAVSRPIGPSLPPGYRPPSPTTIPDPDFHNKHDDDDDDQEDVAGPVPLPAHFASSSSSSSHNEGVQALHDREKRLQELERIQQENLRPKRDEWMLLPPKELDLQASVDPTKIKARGFKQTSKPHASSSGGGSTTATRTAGSLWTETPDERRQRLADEAVGKRRRAEEPGLDEHALLDHSKRAKRDALMRHQVDLHNKSSRNASLLELHKKAESNVTREETSLAGDKKKPSMVVWDHSAMMGVSSKFLSDAQKSELVKDAKGLGGRFGRGSFM
ncbi:hypothetical protein VP01_3895g1 [Puccinia sorghi]|uniref:DUF3752 domain-containing protein n=1 Tax=Puccinia sorghi TaxID=27349 RepID=A0A0L6USR5_9BASI|nr:hypothetical protein VP01_3895g1 [Puccinia sorghi]